MSPRTTYAGAAALLIFAASLTGGAGTANGQSGATPTPPAAASSPSPESPPARQRRQKDPEEQPEHYPMGPHREETFYFCTPCHSFRIVGAQGMSRERWDESLKLMVTRHGMPDVQGQERERILDYLAAAFPERRQPGGWRNPFAPQ